MKTTAERSIEALTWASVVIWLGFALVAHLLGYVFLVVMVLGIILLSSAIYQRSQGWHTSLSIWIFGIWMAVFSVVELVNMLLQVINGGDGLGIDLWVYLGIALVSMGVAVVLRTVSAPSVLGIDQSQGRRQSQAPTMTEGRPFIPNQVASTGSAWTDQPTYQTNAGQQRMRDYDVGWSEPAGVPHDTYNANWPPTGSQPGYTQPPQQYGQPAQPQTGYEAGWSQPQQYGQQPPPQTGYEAGWNQQPPQQYGQQPSQTGYEAGWNQQQYGQQQPPQQYGQQPPQAGYEAGWNQQQYGQQPPPQQYGQQPPQAGYEAGWNQQPQYGQHPPPAGYEAGWNQQPQQYGQQPPPQYDQQAQPARRRSRPVDRRTARPANANVPDNLDQRIEEIIRRSRDRRAGQPAETDDLPY